MCHKTGISFLSFLFYLSDFRQRILNEKRITVSLTVNFQKTITLEIHCEISTECLYFHSFSRTSSTVHVWRSTRHNRISPKIFHWLLINYQDSESEVKTINILYNLLWIDVRFIHGPRPLCLLDPTLPCLCETTYTLSKYLFFCLLTSDLFTFQTPLPSTPLASL